MRRRTRNLIVSIVLVVLLSSVAFSQSNVTITIQDYLQPGNGGRKALMEIIKECEELHPNVTIKHVYVPFASLMQKTLEERLTGAMPDIVWADNPMAPTLIKAGVFMNIKPFIETWSVWKNMYPPYKKLVTMGNKVYGLQIGTNNVLLFYNGKLLKKAGILKPPTTWSELLKACKKLKDKFGKEGIYPIGFSAAPEEECTWQFEPFLWSNGGNLLNLNTPQAIEALKLWVTLVQKGYAPREVVNWGQGDVGTMFANGKLAMMINGCWEFNWHVTKDVREKYEVGVSEIPVPAKNINPVVPFGGEIYGIAFNEPPAKLKIAISFLKFLYSPKNIVKFDIGLSDIPVSETAAPVLEKELGPKLGKLFKPFIEQSKHAVARTVAGGGTLYPKVSSIVWTAIQQALIGSKTPSAAFEEASKRIRELFSSQSEYEKAYEEAESAIEAARK